jgi:hypothetical protein|tara:strand:- start:5766 stop:6323 length:558 start_codon:yes stop_codon:yes gene_type:complete
MVINIKDKIDEIPEIPGYEGTTLKLAPKGEEQRCWNCCQMLNYSVVSNPIRYTNGIFYTSGNFCSYGCGLRHTLDTSTPTDMWERVSLLHIFYKMNTGETTKINPTPSKKSLKVFGGELSYEDFHSRTNFSVDTFSPPILPINNIEYTHENKQKLKKENDEYRIYRRNPIKNKNDIYDTMNLVVG